MESIETISPLEFENLVASYLRSQGYRAVERVGGAGDLGVDIRCTDKHGRLVVVQCKHYTSGAKVGSPEIQHFFGMVVHAGAAGGIFATSSDFTAPAMNLAAQRDIELIDGLAIRAYWAELQRRKLREEQQRQAAVRLRQHETRSHQDSVNTTVRAPQPNPARPPQQSPSKPDRERIWSKEPFDFSLFAIVAVIAFGPGVVSTIAATVLVREGESERWLAVPFIAATLISVLVLFIGDIWMYRNLSRDLLWQGVLASVMYTLVLALAAIGVLLEPNDPTAAWLTWGAMLITMILFERLSPLFETIPPDKMPAWVNQGLAAAIWLTVGGILLLVLRAIID